MGNTRSCGFGVLNNTGDEVTVILSMAGTHYYENNLEPSEIFYRWPGAVFYTVIVYNTDAIGPMTTKTKVKQLAKATTFGVVATGSAAASIAAIPCALVLVEVSAVLVAAEVGASAVSVAGVPTLGKLFKLDKKFAPWNYVEKKGCYGGGNGTWLMLERDEDNNYKLTEIDADFCKRNGVFTKYSKSCYYTRSDDPLLKD